MTTNPDEPLTLLGGLSAREFLRDCWQKEPLLVRQAVSGFESPLTPEELAGLACEDAVISRLVQKEGDNGPWTLRHGPFREADFTSLPDSQWTLLVSDLEKHLPDLRDYLESFRFIPDWRRDDLMVSYAAPGGSVGPHVDQYDVFLLQAHGRRRWQISTTPVREDNYLPGQALRIIRDFVPEYDWILEPGDMLYLPPGIAHYGVAMEPCITWSIGFRAPAWRDVMAAWVDGRYEALSPDDRYSDGNMTPQSGPGEIGATSLRRLRDGLRRAMDIDDAALDGWFGCYLTEPKAELLELLPLPEPLVDEDARHLLESEGRLERHGAARFAWIRGQRALHLFVNGQEHTLHPESEALVRILCDRVVHDIRTLRSLADGIDDARALLLELCRAGVLLPLR